MSKAYRGTVGISAAALIAGSVFFTYALVSTDIESRRPLLTTVPFAARFPKASDLGPSLSEADRQVQRAKVQLAEAMRAAGQQALGPETQGSSLASIPKVPLPRTRPTASVLMANLAPNAGALRDQSPDPFPDVSAAVRKMFAMLQPSDTKVASASPDGGISNDGRESFPVPGMRQTAVYDIVAMTVYMPDGTRLEAHSGLGELLDDPSHVHIRDRGATPPQMYELTLREKLFHGVEALRMKPVGEGDLFGRSGLLAHSYLMGPRGDSNGCVSFKDYEAFLKAYKAGEVKRLIVVTSLSDPAIADARKN